MRACILQHAGVRFNMHTARTRAFKRRRRRRRLGRTVNRARINLPATGNPLPVILDYYYYHYYCHAGKGGRADRFSKETAQKKF